MNDFNLLNGILLLRSEINIVVEQISLLFFNKFAKLFDNKMTIYYFLVNCNGIRLFQMPLSPKDLHDIRHFSFRKIRFYCSKVSLKDSYLLNVKVSSSRLSYYSAKNILEINRIVNSPQEVIKLIGLDCKISGDVESFYKH